MRGHPLICSLAALLSLFLTSELRAENGASVAVVGVHGSGGEDAEELRAITEDLVAGFKIVGLEVVYGEDLRARLEGVEARLTDTIWLEPARQNFEEGRILYEKAQPQQAVEALSRAEGAIEGVEEFIRDPRLSIEVQLYLGLSHLSLGREDDAGAAFSEVVRMDPDRVLDTLDYPPRIVDLFDAVRTDVLSREGATLEIATADRPGARVFLDGRMVGTTPLTVSSLPPGFHTVLIDGGTSGRWFQDFVLASGEQRGIVAELKRVGLGRSTVQGFEEPRSGVTRRLYRELAVAAGTDLVAVAAFDHQGDFRLALYSGRSGTFSSSVTIGLSGSPGARSAFIRQLVERVAFYADDRGAVRGERVSVEAIPLQLGANSVLNDYLFGVEEPEVVLASTPAETEPTARVTRKPPKAFGVVMAVVAGVLGASAAGVGIYAGVQANQSAGGVLVVEIP